MLEEERSCNDMRSSKQMPSVG